MAEAIVVEGFYQGKDIYVKNSMASAGVGFCVYEVQVNGDVTSDEINSSAFVIDLHSLGLAMGDAITVTILHHDGCAPKVLNLDAVLPQSTYELSDMSISDSGLLTWETKYEMGELPYIIQQYKWNKWIKIGEVIGTGRMDKNSYSFQVEPHSGKNIYRIAQKTNKGKMRMSDELSYTANTKGPVTFEPGKISNAVRFSGQTHYEIFDEFGRLVKRGFDQEVNVSALKKGRYYINYDNRFGESFSKR